MIEPNSIRKKAKVAFAGGGTGGHIYPIIAVFQNLKEKTEYELNFTYFVSKGKLEENIAQQYNIPSNQIPFVGGMPRSFKAIFWIFKFAFACLYSLGALAKEKPNIIFGTGGYSAAPIFWAARKLKIPYIIHNLDAHFGLANLAFVRESAALTLGMPIFNLTPKMKPKNGPIIVTGNPVRKEFQEQVPQQNKQEIYTEMGLDSKRKTLVVTGGSQGAQFINELIFKIAPDLIESNWQIIHQLGDKQFEQFKDFLLIDPHYKPEKYLNNLDRVYSIADLAISRSGAMSLAELAAKQVPCIFIPLPTAAQNHQYYNAKYLEEKSCALVAIQSELTEKNLKEYINLALERQNLMKINLKNITRKNSAELISNTILNSLA